QDMGQVRSRRRLQSAHRLGFNRYPGAGRRYDIAQCRESSQRQCVEVVHGQSRTSEGAEAGRAGQGLSLYVQSRDTCSSKGTRTRRGRQLMKQVTDRAETTASRWQGRVVLSLAMLVGLASLATAQDIQDKAAKAPSNPQLVSPQIERRVNALLGEMTLEEKFGQLVQYNSVGTASATVAAGQESELAANPQANYHVDAMQLAQAGKLGSMLNVN